MFLSLAARLLPINMIFNTIVFLLAYRTYLRPALTRLGPERVLRPILLLHATRNLGLLFLTPGVVLPGLPARFAYPAALGDVLTAVLALIAFAALASENRWRWTLIWLFNILGSLDLLEAILQAVLSNAAPMMGAAYWIPAIWVPALLATHYVVFVVLILRQKQETTNAHAVAASR
ncbi:hypothetical protein CCAX7_63880 [Capsulimonas corticalis]|uniref:Uncharacterized protein n=1 Tax=Capsulimonas corticalis TaxID=2219043 RepID=A0A402CX18_9BACT|nr:hypothetical protein [Capsulimonas corticalis]BDI34337.1 hypothetical protein CCAX7_63880 [Capsulimonas corticalis]